MLPPETSKAGLRRIDFDILDYLEYPKTVDQIEIQFPNTDVKKTVLKLQVKNLIIEKKSKLMSKFYTPNTQKMIDNSKLVKDLKKNLHFFLSQIDNHTVREKFYDSETREKIDFIFSIMTKSYFQSLSNQDLSKANSHVNRLMRKLG